MSNHSKGPWKVEELDDHSCCNIIAKDGYDITSFPSCDPEDHGRGDEDRANWKLVAAAPDLLNTIKKMKRLIEHLRIDEVKRKALNDLNFAHSQLEIAIDRAEGGK